jgi:anti-anti-sigma regulatory factor
VPDRSDQTTLRVDLAGDLRGAAVVEVLLMLLEAIVVDRADELVIDLDAVACLGSAGLAALVCGYVTAVGRPPCVRPGRRS